MNRADMSGAWRAGRREDTTGADDRPNRRPPSPRTGNLTRVGDPGRGADTVRRPRRGRVPVRRNALLRYLGAVADDVPLVLLVGAAGYGKTTLLQQWANEDDRRFGWVRLRESDNDPAL